MDTARQVHAHAPLPDHRSPPLLQLVLMVSLFPEKIAPILDSAALLVATAIARRQLVLPCNIYLLWNKDEGSFGYRNRSRRQLLFQLRTLPLRSFL